MTPQERLDVLLAHLEQDRVEEPTLMMDFWGTCAIGEAARLPALRAEGLDLREDYPGGYLRPHYGTVRGLRAVAEFFGLSWEGALDVFCGELLAKPCSPMQVARHLRRVVYGEGQQ